MTTLLEIKIWIDEEQNLRVQWALPHVTDDTMVEFYATFMEELCKQIAKVPGAEKLVGLSVQVKETEDD